MKQLLPLLLLFPLFLFGQEFPQKPTNYVTSFDPFYLKNHVLNQQEEELLNAKLRAFENSTGIQLFVYLTPYGPIKYPEAYSQKIFNTWSIGQKGKENGILLAIFTSDQKYTVHVGFGLETELPSEVCMQILDNEMAPHFKDENFYKGIDAGIDKLIYYSNHKYEPPGLFHNIKEKIPAVLGVSVLTLPFLISFLFKMKRRK